MYVYNPGWEKIYIIFERYNYNNFQLTYISLENIKINLVGFDFPTL